MKVIVWFLALIALASSVMALKNEICGQPHSKDGVCYASHHTWTYKADSNECIPFIYGGCGGNDNRFSTQEECQQKCVE